MNKHKNQIPLHTWAILGNTCFWPLIKPFFVDIMTKEQITKKEIDLQLILKQYESDTKEFKFGKMVKKITSDDVKKFLASPQKATTSPSTRRKQKGSIHSSPSISANARMLLQKHNYYNWSLIVIQFLEKGLTKHKKDKPITLSGCLLLILYWFLDNTKAKRCIRRESDAEPTFTKWSIQNIFDWETYKSNSRLAKHLHSLNGSPRQPKTTGKKQLKQLKT
ncbi:hypothetical protein M0R45_008916 [Rubus argutus]|uniref:Uncharacterized protein n=1 Tax=Rubus argutus TaxID=59490 RepID=A0AAW1Y5W8_RUBAR